MTVGSEPYVSRAGRKLAHALDAFQIEVAGRVVLDAGSSTGGFTDCCLQRGASRIYAVDVGYGILAWRLRQDPRVVVLERTNLRTLPTLPAPAPDCATLDLSFISLCVVWPAVLRLLTRPATVLALVKPQFEARRDQVGRGGIVDPEIGREVATRVVAALTAQEPGTVARGPIPAEPPGRRGNREWTAVLELGARSAVCG
ncbi:MAG TPA: TlyA family RNA methyltransferase [Verrucomicrobiae bacterium]|nr:TlyA family RNA methyltransferase [Verrucomicrobiae bacterium]